MNYALDALWWRLQTPVVRDLASLLTAPAPWHSHHELSIPLLLGIEGFRYLLALDQSPDPLEHYLQSSSNDYYRLGRYAERLLAFWFSHAPHAKLIWQNFCIKEHDQVLGEIDFIVQLNNQFFHIELACKYYGLQGDDCTKLVGLNPQDRWQDKETKLKQQLARISCDQVQKALCCLGIDGHDIQSVTLLRGMIFTEHGHPLKRQPFNPLGWTGYYVHEWRSLLPLLSNIKELYYFVLIQKKNLLAPQRLPVEKTINWQQLQTIQQGIVAVLIKRPDGYAHEIERIMKI